MIDKSRILIISNHHRRSLFFEDTMRRLHNNGFKRIFIQETGNLSYGPYKGPSRKHWSIKEKSYDKGMVSFRKRITKRNDNIDVILYIDNDCFLGNIENFITYLNEFISGNYDFTCHFADPSHYQDYKFNNSLIQQVKNQKILPAKIYPGVVPNPHWENSYMLIKKECWDKLSENDISHGRLFIKALVREKAKIGVHKASYKLRYSHYGDGWFHVGNLMKYYYAVENLNLKGISLTSKYSLARFGYFIAQSNIYGSQIYPSSIRANLSVICRKAGGRQKVLDNWNSLVEETCMRNWKRAG
jgi:hypothetical protein